MVLFDQVVVNEMDDTEGFMLADKGKTEGDVSIARVVMSADDTLFGSHHHVRTVGPDSPAVIRSKGLWLVWVIVPVADILQLMVSVEYEKRSGSFGKKVAKGVSDYLEGVFDSGTGLQQSSHAVEQGYFLVVLFESADPVG